jgi:hypothetical protein
MWESEITGQGTARILGIPTISVRNLSAQIVWIPTVFSRILEIPIFRIPTLWIRSIGICILSARIISIWQDSRGFGFGSLDNGGIFRENAARSRKLETFSTENDKFTQAWAADFRAVRLSDVDEILRIASKSRGVASMSETTASKSPESRDANAAPDESEETFNKADLHFFDAEDGQAGSVIGKMLALFFLYTVIVMALVAYWTFSVAR